MLPRRKFLAHMSALLGPAVITPRGFASNATDQPSAAPSLKPPASFTSILCAEFDDAVGELHDGDLLVVGGRPTSGRTSLLLSIATHITAGLRWPAAIFSAPYSAQCVRDRLVDVLADQLRGNAHAWQRRWRPDEFRMRALRMLEASHLLIDERSGLSVDDLAMQVFRNNIRAGRRNGTTLLLDPDGISIVGSERPPLSLDSALRGLGEIYGGPVLCRTTFAPSPGAPSMASSITFEPNVTARSLARASSVVLLAHRPLARGPGAAEDAGRLILMTKSPKNRRGVVRMSLGG
jgi:hypothetical protein